MNLIGETAYRTAVAASGIPPGPPGGPEIAAITADSRTVRPGALFVALPGSTHDGRAFIGAAVAAGAVAVLAPTGTAPADAAGAILIADANPRRRLALMAATFYGAQPHTVAAVTGTNGKTSTAAFLRQIWQDLGGHAASLGTLGVYTGRDTKQGGPSLTTADPVALHRILAELAASGVDRVAMEASSHGLDQCRLDGVRLAAGALTNVTRDHLDYHGSMEAYRAAKLRLFDALLPPGAAAIVRDAAPERDAVAAIAGRRGLDLLTYGIESGDIHCARADIADIGWSLTLSLRGRNMETRFPLPGRFQLENALCALALAIGSGADPVRAAAALTRLDPVPGRMEIAGRLANGAAVIVDYAHTPDALETVLSAIRPFARHRLSVVFGCGGDRDPGKRPIMGEIAARIADDTIVTDDNPRGEDPALIRRAILAGCPAAREIGDRAAAIRAGVAALGPGDVLLVAGKGHETGQTAGGKTLPFYDFDAVRDAVAARGDGAA